MRFSELTPGQTAAIMHALTLLRRGGAGQAQVDAAAVALVGYAESSRGAWRAVLRPGVSVAIPGRDSTDADLQRKYLPEFVWGR